MNDGRLPGQRTRCHSIVQTRSGENLAHPKIQSFPDRLNALLKYCFFDFSYRPKVQTPFTTLVSGPIRAQHRLYWALIG